MKKVLIFGTNAEAPYHPLNRVKKYFESALSDSFDVYFSDDINDLRLLSSGEFTAAISYFDLWNENIPDYAVSMIRTFISVGGGFIIIHNGISLQGDPGFREISGAEFSGHPPYQKISYKVSKNHFITENIDDFSLSEEPYTFNFFNIESFTVLIDSISEDGTSSPALWIKECEKGRIAYFAPGHDEKTFEKAEVGNLILRITQWCSTNA